MWERRSLRRPHDRLSARRKLEAPRKVGDVLTWIYPGEPAFHDVCALSEILDGLVADLSKVRDASELRPTGRFMRASCGGSSPRGDLHTNHTPPHA
jgi:hypothetical protein